MKRLIACVLGLALAMTLVLTLPVAAEEYKLDCKIAEGSMGDILYQENFDNIAEGTLPEGYVLSEALVNGGGSAEVKDGKLRIDATGVDLGKVLLPSSLMTATDYRIDVDVAFQSSRDASRYASVVFRQQETDYDFYHMCFRFTPSGSNGCEMAVRSKGGWNVIKKGPADLELDYGDTAHLTIFVYKDQITEFVNGEEVLTISLVEAVGKYQPAGGLALQCNYSIVDFDNVVVQALNSDPLGNAASEVEEKITPPASTYIRMNKDGNAETLAAGEGKGITAEVTEEGYLRLTVETGAQDPQFPIRFADLGLDEMVTIEEYPIMAICARVVSGYAGSAQCYFYTTSVAGATGEVVTTYAYETDNEWHNYKMSATVLSNFENFVDNEDCWNGMRFDAVGSGDPNGEVVIDVAWIAFFENMASFEAFDGDFDNLPTPAPTDTPAPTNTPVPTAEPTDVPENPTDAPETAAPTDEPAGDKDPESKKGCGSTVGFGAVSVLLIMSAVVLKKKETR